MMNCSRSCWFSGIRGFASAMPPCSPSNASNRRSFALHTEERHARLCTTPSFRDEPGQGHQGSPRSILVYWPGIPPDADAQRSAPHKDEHIANRQIGTIQQIEADGHLQIRRDSGRQRGPRAGSRGRRRPTSSSLTPAWPTSPSPEVATTPKSTRTMPTSLPTN